MENEKQSLIEKIKENNLLRKGLIISNIIIGLIFFPYGLVLLGWYLHKFYVIRKIKSKDKERKISKGIIGKGFK